MYLDIKQLEEVILNTDFSDTYGDDKQSKLPNTPIEKLASILKTAVDSTLEDPLKKFQKHAEDFLTLAYAFRIGFSSSDNSKKQGVNVNSTASALK